MKSGWPIATDTFYPFGLEQTAPSDPNHYKFTGKERDAESGNDYFGARFYSFGEGRFLSPDWAAKATPIPYAKLDNPQSLNLYAYVLNNPLSHVDLDGHIDCSGKNAEGAGCLAIASWNQQHDIVGFGNEAQQQSVSQGTTTTLPWTGVLGEIFGDITAAGADIAGSAVLGLTYLASPGTTASESQDTIGPAPVPAELVGTQDGKSGHAGGRQNSGPLDPTHGGTGDAARDFANLTGGKSAPAPAGSNYPPGTLVGDNGVSLRPARGNSGPRIDIPANGNKPHETLHYPN